MYKNYYDEIQVSGASRRYNNIQPCRIADVNEECGLFFKLPWGNETTFWIRPIDFEVAGYQTGEWVDLILNTISGGNSITLRSAQFIGRTPKTFVPKE